MSRTSRIPHPRGSVFVPIHQWAVARFGLAEAAVIGLLDFWDQGERLGGQPLASRQTIISELEGIVGKHLVDRALRALMDAGAIYSSKKTEIGERNLQTWVNYGLDLERLTDILGSGTPDFGNSDESRNRVSPEAPRAVPKSGVPSNKGIDIEAAASHAHARDSANAAATYQSGKVRTVRPSGIVTWCSSDVPAAEQIESLHGAEDIGAAVITVAATGKDPVPGLVARALARQLSVQQAAQRRAEAEAAYQARISAATNPDFSTNRAAIQRGDEILAKLRQKTINTKQSVAS